MGWGGVARTQLSLPQKIAGIQNTRPSWPRDIYLYKTVSDHFLHLSGWLRLGDLVGPGTAVQVMYCL